MLFLFFFFTGFFVLPSHVISFVFKATTSLNPVLVLSIWFWPKLKTNPPVRSEFRIFSFILQQLISAQRKDVQCLSLRSRTGVAAQSSFYKVKKCSQGEAVFHCAASDMSYLTG